MKFLQITAFSVGITILNQRIILKTISNSSLNSHVYWYTLYQSREFHKFSYEQLIVAPLKFMVFTKFSHFREKMRKFAKEFVKRDQKLSPFFHEILFAGNPVIKPQV